MRVMPEDRDQEQADRAAREAVSHVHAVEPKPKPVVLPEEDFEAGEDMAQHSPDGRPPRRPVRRIGTATMVVLLVLSAVGVVVLVLTTGGPGALAMAIGYLVVVGLAAFPVWLSGWMRHEEDKEAHDHVREQHSH